MLTWSCSSPDRVWKTHSFITVWGEFTPYCGSDVPPTTTYKIWCDEHPLIRVRGEDTIAVERYSHTVKEIDIHLLD